jgi:hypothetical protein
MVGTNVGAGHAPGKSAAAREMARQRLVQAHREAVQLGVTPEERLQHFL